MVKMNDPTAIIKIGRPGKVLILENHLSVLKDEELENATPYSIHSGFSVFKLKHLENGRCVSANIPPKKLADIEAKTVIANELIVKERLNASGGKIGSSSNSPCYTLKFRFGTFKDKTPAQVLSEDPANKEKIISERGNLERNLSNPKFEASNRALINAIDEAIKLMEAGELNKEAATPTSTSAAFYIYKEDCKIPNIKKLVEKQGKQVTYVYSVKIQCNPTMDSPIVVDIMNCYAPVNGHDIVLKEAVEVENSKFVMTEGEWNSILKAMSQTETMFKMFNYKQIDTKVNETMKAIAEQIRGN